MIICFIKSSGWPTAPFRPHFKLAEALFEVVKCPPPGLDVVE
jgi:hypothetical protein